VPRHKLKKAHSPSGSHPARGPLASSERVLEDRGARNSLPDASLESFDISDNRSDGPEQDEAFLYTHAFEAAVDRLGRIADKLESLALTSAMAVARIEAEGDRIDRLIAENQGRLDDLLAGNW
jgi:hypothetical protein